MGEKIFKYAVVISFHPFSTSTAKFYDELGDAEKEFNREWIATLPSYNKHIRLVKVECHYENGVCYYLRELECLRKVKAS